MALPEMEIASWVEKLGIVGISVSILVWAKQIVTDELADRKEMRRHLMDLAEGRAVEAAKEVEAALGALRTEISEYRHAVDRAVVELRRQRDEQRRPPDS